MSASQCRISSFIRANRETLEAATQHSFEQGLTLRLVALDEIFVKMAENDQPIKPLAIGLPGGGSSGEPLAWWQRIWPHE